MGLQWGDIKGGSLTVNRALAFVGNQSDPSQELKTKAAHRTIPIPEPLVEILHDLPKTGLYVITKADGGPMTQMAFRRLWEKVTKMCIRDSVCIGRGAEVGGNDIVEFSLIAFKHFSSIPFSEAFKPLHGGADCRAD